MYLKFSKFRLSLINKNHFVVYSNGKSLIYYSSSTTTKIFHWKWGCWCSRILIYFKNTIPFAGVEIGKSVVFNTFHCHVFSWNLFYSSFLFVRYMHWCKMWWSYMAFQFIYCYYTRMRKIRNFRSLSNF